MAIVLEDGTVIPSHLDVSSSAERTLDAARPISNNTALRIGYLMGIHYPGASGSEKDQIVTYDVICPQLDGSGAETWTMYRKCRLMHPVGSMADRQSQTLRAPSRWNGVLDNAFLKQTTKVLLLCVNGRSSNAYIIGADQHPNVEPEKKADGRHLSTTFNGVAVQINDAGEYSIEVAGATKNDGSPDVRDPNLKGTSVKFSKDGDITISNGDTESIKISTSDNSITVKADTKIVVDGGKVYVGKDGAAENLVLGQQLVSALGAFVDIWVQQASAVAVAGNLGFPVPLSPAIVAALQAWKLQWVTSTVKPATILSEDHFTER